MACNLDLDEDQRRIRDAAAAILHASYPVSRLRREEPDSLAALAGFGAFALALPERTGGAGLSEVEAALVHVLLGRHLVTTRAVATAIAAHLAADLGQDALAADIAGDRLPVCAALPSESGLLLLDRAGARRALVFGERTLHLVELADEGATTLAGLGHRVRVARLPRSAARPLVESGSAVLRRIADLLVCAGLVGVAEATRDLAVDYAKLRRQFGRPIGSFQAVKHQCANMAIGVEMLAAQLDMAAIASRDGRDDADFQAAALVLLAGRTAMANARACVQVHGGIGFSAEADAHHYVRHAHVLQLLTGRRSILDLAAPLAPHVTRDERS